MKFVTGYQGEVVFDATKPDGTMKKLMDSSKLNAMGWQAQTTLDKGLINAYKAFVESI